MKSTTDFPASDDAAYCASSVEVVETIRQEWMLPDFYSEGEGGRPYPGYVALKTTVGWLLLGCVEKFQTSTSGGFRRRLLRAHEIPLHNAEVRHGAKDDRPD